jgi:hypothetical protein
MVAAMRARYDQLGKHMTRDTCDDWSLETDAEVSAETRRIDVWATPRDTSPLREHLGLLGRLITGAFTFELFHNTPSGDELHLCLIKHGEFRRSLSRRKTPPPLPILWVISSGRPDAGIEGLGFCAMPGGVRGIYEAPPLYYARLVVVSELPVVHDTLALRLYGAGSMLRQAIAELQALPVEAPLRRIVLPLLLRFALTVPTDPAQRTSEDEEFLMDTQDIVETWRREAVQEGLELGERKLLLRLLRRRFGTEVDSETERLVATAPTEQIEAWAGRLWSAATLAELLAD